MIEVGGKSGGLAGRQQQSLQLPVCRLLKRCFAWLGAGETRDSIFAVCMCVCVFVTERQSDNKKDRSSSFVIRSQERFESLCRLHTPLEDDAGP